MILASGSPQRRAILRQLGVEFRVLVPGATERDSGDPREVVAENALRKVRAIERERERVLAADTAVVVDGHVLGKPRDRSQAASFLRVLSGRSHEVMSGISIREPDGSERGDVAVTRVRFRSLEQSDLDWYLGMGEWEGRAGGYAIQERGAALVEEIQGDYLNVVGLPVAALLRLVPDLLTG